MNWRGALRAREGSGGGGECNLADEGEDLGHEGDCLLRLLDHLAHVVHDGARLTHTHTHTRTHARTHARTRTRTHTRSHHPSLLTLLRYHLARAGNNRARLNPLPPCPSLLFVCTSAIAPRVRMCFGTPPPPPSPPLPSPPLPPSAPSHLSPLCAGHTVSHALRRIAIAPARRRQ